jgi:hypothetical protein
MTGTRCTVPAQFRHCLANDKPGGLWGRLPCEFGDALGRRLRRT